MEPKIYTGFGTYKCKDGTVKRFETKRVYIPKTPSGQKQVRPIRKGSINGVMSVLKDLDASDVEKVRLYACSLRDV